MLQNAFLFIYVILAQRFVGANVGKISLAMRIVGANAGRLSFAPINIILTGRKHHA